MRKVSIISLAVTLVFAGSLRAEEATFGDAQLLAVEKICVRMLGRTWKQAGPDFVALRAYRRDPKDGLIICSGGCSTTLRLRGGLLLALDGPNVPRGYPGYVRNPPITTAVIYREPKNKGDHDRTQQPEHVVFSALRGENSEVYYLGGSRQEMLTRINSAQAPIKIP